MNRLLRSTFDKSKTGERQQEVDENLSRLHESSASIRECWYGIAFESSLPFHNGSPACRRHLKRDTLCVPRRPGEVLRLLRQLGPHLWDDLRRSALCTNGGALISSHHGRAMNQYTTSGPTFPSAICSP